MAAWVGGDRESEGRRHRLAVCLGSATPARRKTAGTSRGNGNWQATREQLISLVICKWLPRPRWKQQ